MLTETAAVSFEQSTIVAMDGLFSISYRPPAAPPPTLRVLHAGQNLLAAAEGTALVRVEGVASEADLRRRFSWQGKRNLYGSAGPLLSWAMAGELSPPRKYEGEAWVELWGRAEDEPRFVRGLRFSGRLDLMTRFQGLVPRDLRITVPAPLDPDLLGRGADLDRVYRQERESFGDINP
ncbi:MAG TPA: hypothetical protein PKC45_10530 [Gemmatales bacterium]|nr:hypothetical protein [Gemmatales bacterium]